MSIQNEYHNSQIQGNARNSATFPVPLQHRLVTDRLHIWHLGMVGPIEALYGQLIRMNLTYFCDIDRHLKENLQNRDLTAGFLGDTPVRNLPPYPLGLEQI